MGSENVSRSQAAGAVESGEAAAGYGFSLPEGGPPSPRLLGWRWGVKCIWCCEEGADMWQLRGREFPICHSCLIHVNPPRKRSANPMVRTWGEGPAGVACAKCSHLFARQFAGRYYKCDLRKLSNGPGTDHRVNWPACAKFEPCDGELRVVHGC